MKVQYAVVFLGGILFLGCSSDSDNSPTESVGITSRQIDELESLGISIFLENKERYQKWPSSYESFREDFLEQFQNNEASKILSSGRIINDVGLVFETSDGRRLFHGTDETDFKKRERILGIWIQTMPSDIDYKSLTTYAMLE